MIAKLTTISIAEFIRISVICKFTASQFCKLANLLLNHKFANFEMPEGWIWPNMQISHAKVKSVEGHGWKNFKNHCKATYGRCLIC